MEIKGLSCSVKKKLTRLCCQENDLFQMCRFKACFPDLPFQSNFFQIDRFKEFFSRFAASKQDAVLQSTFHKMNLSIRIHHHRPTRKHPDRRQGLSLFETDQ